MALLMTAQRTHLRATKALQTRSPDAVEFLARGHVDPLDLVERGEAVEDGRMPRSLLDEPPLPLDGRGTSDVCAEAAPVHIRRTTRRTCSLRRRAHAVAVVLVLSGCMTTAGIVKGDQTSKPIAFGAIGGDLVVTTVVAHEVEDFSWGASLATAAAITAVDVFVGCLLGSCRPLKLW